MTKHTSKPQAKLPTPLARAHTKTADRSCDTGTTFGQLFTKTLAVRGEKTPNPTLELPRQRFCSAKEGQLEYPSSPAFSCHYLSEACSEKMDQDRRPHKTVLLSTSHGSLKESNRSGFWNHRNYFLAELTATGHFGLSLK